MYAVTHDPILCYNVLFLSTFVLSGLGMFLLARELTGSREAALVAGLAFAFAPYRVASMPHVQVLSSAWMPFALYGFRRYFTCSAALQGCLAAVGRPQGLRYETPLVGASAAWLVQNLSSGYYLLFFSPVVVVYLVWEISARSLWRDRRVVLSVIAACGFAAAATVPFLLPYLELRRLGFSPRSLSETIRFSADVYAYLTADPNLRFWGPILQGWPKAEGALFPGLTIVALAICGVDVARAFKANGGRSAESLALRRLTLLVLITSVVILVSTLFGRSFRFPGLKITSFPRALVVVSVLACAWLIVSVSARDAVRRRIATPAGIFMLIALLAIVMSWGPMIQARGRTVAATNLYAIFYNHVPGFDGVRVPARFGMIVALSLAVLAAFGAAALQRWRLGRPLVAVAALAIVLESLAVPIPINQNSIEYRRAGLAPLPGVLSLTPPPVVYQYVSSLPAGTAIVELPLGEPAFDVRYMIFSTTHWKPLVNGYSGGAPIEYERLDQSLQDALIRPDRAWQALVDSRATHAIVHEAFYIGDRGGRVSEWLRSRGAHQIATFDRDRVFQLQ